MQNNAIAHLKGYGIADISANEVFTHATPSVVGSVSKTWTALAVLRLKELNYLDLQDTLGDHLSSVPPAWQAITIQQLLSHTSSLKRDPNFDPALNDEAELNAFLFNMGPFPPHPGIHPRWVYYTYQQTPLITFGAGLSASYSNVGYMLLGAIVDKIVRTNSVAIGVEFSAFESFVWRYVGVNQMVSPCLWEDWRHTDIPNLAAGYRFTNPGYQQLTHTSGTFLSSGPLGWEGPAGGWTMTIGDLVRLMMAIQNNDIILPATKNLMMQVYGSDNSGNWGFGVNLIQKLGRSVFMHDGLIAGYRARYTVWPGENFGVAIMANEESAGMRDITDDIATFFIGASRMMATAGVLDDNDPGLGAAVSTISIPPSLTIQERDENVLEHRELEGRQLLVEQERRELEVILQAEGCAALAQRLVGQPGSDLNDPFALCFDSSQSERELDSCIVLATQDLVQRQIITEQQELDLQSCATTIYCSDNACGVLIPAVSEWGLAVMVLLLLSAGTLVVMKGREAPL